jgi:hypothetical protein
MRIRFKLLERPAGLATALRHWQPRRSSARRIIGNRIAEHAGARITGASTTRTLSIAAIGSSAPAVIETLDGPLSVVRWDEVVCSGAPSSLLFALPAA